MIKSLRAAFVVWVAAAVTAGAGTSTVNYTQTNVLQNVNLQLTIYQQGPTNSNGKKVAAQITSYTTKNLIADLSAITGQQFPAGSKLVLSTVYASATVPVSTGIYSTVLSTNLALGTNDVLNVGGVPLFYGFNGDSGILTISSNTITSQSLGSIPSNMTTNTVTDAGSPSESVTINTNSGSITTITPSTNGTGDYEDVTNVLIVTQQAPTIVVFTNISSSIDILNPGAPATLFPVDNYLSFGTNGSAEIVVETGTGLNTTNALTVTNLVSQLGFSVQGLTISNYSIATGSNILTLNLMGFVKQSLKVDTLYSHGTNKIVADIFGANSTWNVFGAGYTGGLYFTNLVPFGTSVYLTNAIPIVAEGSINVSFLKNLPQ